MTSPHDIDPTGAHGARPDAGQRTDLPVTPVSEHREDGLLRIGTEVQVTVLGPGGFMATGPIVDAASVPAAYLSIARRGDIEDRVVVFTGPGVLVERAVPHPGLG